MKNPAKLAAVSVIALIVLLWLSSDDHSPTNAAAVSKATAQPTPSASPAKQPSNAVASPTSAHSSTTPTAANSNSSPMPSASAESNKIKTIFRLDDDPEGAGVVEFNHDTHSSKPYSIDGKSVITCTECHHQEKSFSFAEWKKSGIKPKNCHVCHNLDSADKYHESCYGCHDQAFDRVKANNPKFGTSNNCDGCHLKK